MPASPLVADLGRALELLGQVDESQLAFSPNPEVSEDVKSATGVQPYPTESHRANVSARLDAVLKAGDSLPTRNPSDYVSKIIVECVRLAPASDDWSHGPTS